ncbi:RNA methyltransferase [Georgenia phoenicis]|uniref:TrmH family RNA methyltransferase n=1 Tax=unclassified Georgenia TaxID=2626815 RepID=UPI0039AFBBFD
MTERPDLLTNPRSDRVRMVKRLSGRSARLRHGQFLVEGPQGVREAVLHAPDRVRDLYLSTDAAERYPEILAAARSAVRHTHLATAEVLAAMSGDAQGVLAVVHAEPAVLPAAAPRLVAVLPWAADPGNLGTIVRAADAAGADAVVLGPGSVEPHNPKVVRSTAGSLFHLPVVLVEDLAGTVASLREQGVQVLAAAADGEWDLDQLADHALLATLPPRADSTVTADSTLTADSTVSADSTVTADSTVIAVPDLRRPTAWLFGNEAHGLRDEERDLADAVVAVPIHGLAESLNVATAATLCLYASARAQRR